MAEHDPFTVDDVQKRRAVILNRFEDRKLGDICRVMALPEGRRFLWRILVEAKIHHSCFDSNALVMAQNEGRRDIGLFIESEILKAKPEAVEEMRREAVSDRLNREAELLNAEKEKQNG